MAGEIRPSQVVGREIRPSQGRGEEKLGPVDQQVAELAARQHGVVALDQLGALGLQPGGVAHRLLAGRLHRLHAGVYAVGHMRLTQRGRWMAAVLACGDGALLSHRSASELWGIGSHGEIRTDVTVPDRSGRRRPNIAIHRPRTLRDKDRVTLDGIPVHDTRPNPAGPGRRGGPASSGGGFSRCRSSRSARSARARGAVRAQPATTGRAAPACAGGGVPPDPRDPVGTRASVRAALPPGGIAAAGRQRPRGRIRGRRPVAGTTAGGRARWIRVSPRSGQLRERPCPG